MVVFAEKGTHDIRRYMNAPNNSSINTSKRQLKDSEISRDETAKKLKQTNMDKYLLSGNSDNNCNDVNDTQMRIERKRIGRSDDTFDERKKRMRYGKDLVDVDVRSSVDKLVGFKRSVASPNTLSTRNTIDITSGRYSKHPRLKCSHEPNLPKHGPTLWDPYSIN